VREGFVTALAVSLFRTSMGRPLFWRPTRSLTPAERTGAGDTPAGP